MRCLVTGASGFLGSWLVRQLLEEGHSVTVWMRNAAPTLRNADWIGNARILQGSFDNLESLRAGMERDSFDCFFHLAWLGVAAEDRNSARQVSVNVAATLQLWELANHAGCKHWISVGSQAEYGPCSGVLHETLPPSPATAYGVAKLACGMLTRKLSELSGIRHTWVRLLAAYGPGDDRRHLVPSVMQALCSGKSPSLTKGEQLCDFLYVSDAARALCQIATAQAAGIFNLSSGEPVEIRKLVEMIRDLIDPRLPLEFGSIPYRPDQVMRMEADAGRLRSATGWKPELPLQEGLRKTLEWFRTERANACANG